VREWLNNHFNNSWLGRFAPEIQWPARSCDIAVLDFFIWGYHA